MEINVEEKLHKVFPTAVRKKWDFLQSRYKAKQDLGLSVRNDWTLCSGSYLLSESFNSAFNGYRNNGQIGRLLELAAISCAMWWEKEGNDLTAEEEAIAQFTQKLEGHLTSSQLEEEDFISAFVNHYQNYLSSNSDDRHLLFTMETLALKWWEEYQSDRRHKVVQLYFPLAKNFSGYNQRVLPNGASFLGEYLDGSILPIEYWRSSEDAPVDRVKVRVDSSFNCEFWDTLYTFKEYANQENELTPFHFH